MKRLLSVLSVLCISIPAFTSEPKVTTFPIVAETLQCPGGRCPTDAYKPLANNGARKAEGVGQCVVIVHMDNGWGGSGTVIESGIKDVGLCITAAHVVGGSKNGTLVFHDGKDVRAGVLASDPKTDCAAMTFRAFEGMKVTEVAKSPPTVGEEIVKVGYPAGGWSSRGFPSCIFGKVVRCRNEIGTSIQCRSGDSGGGFFDMEGHLVGCVWGDRSPDDARSFGPGQPQLKVFVEEKCFPRLRRGVEVVISSPGQQEPATKPVPMPDIKPAGPSKEDFDKLQKQLADIQEALKGIKPIPGPKGDKGDPGKDGEVGAKGEQGMPGVKGDSADKAEIEALKLKLASLEAKLTAVETKLNNVSGSVRIVVQPKP